MKNDIKKDLVVLNYLKRNNLVENIKEDLVNYYTSHSCAEREDVEKYLEKNFTVSALLEMLSEIGGSCVAEHCKCKRVSASAKNAEENTAPVERAEVGEQDFEGTNLYGKQRVYRDFKEAEQFKYDGLVFTKECPDLGGNDVVACYLIGKNRNQVVDPMFVTLDGKYGNLLTTGVGEKLRHAYSQNINARGLRPSYCKLNNHNKGRIYVRDKRNGHIYKSIKDAAKAFDVSYGKMQKMLKNKEVEAEYVL